MVYLFETYALDTDRRELRCGPSLVSVEPQVFDILAFLIKNRERVVSKDDLLAAVWNGRIVSDSTLSSRLTAARIAIEDSGKEQRLIKTLPRKGVRFIGAVCERQSSAGSEASMPAPIAAPDREPENAPRTLHVADIATRETSPTLVLPDKPSIAVLPFTNLSGDPAQDYFSDGMVEDLITALSKVRWFFVIARNSSFTYKGKSVEAKQIGRELGVRYLLEGSVRRAGSRVRISAQLIDAVTGHHVWAERYDRDAADVFAVQDEITEQVVTAIEPQLYAVEGVRVKRKPPENLSAWECVIRALSLMNSRERPDVTVASALLRRAIGLDPNYAQAHSLLAFLLTLGVHQGWERPESALALASEHARKALFLDPDDPWTHLAWGYVLVWSRRPGDAIEEFEKALALNPNFAIAHYVFALACCYLGRGEEALAHGSAAARLSPRDLLARGNAGAANNVRATACFVTGRYREGLGFARRAVAESPNLTSAYRMLVITCALAGEIEGAKAALKILRGLQPDISLKWIEEVWPFVRAEERERCVRAFRLAGLE